MRPLNARLRLAAALALAGACLIPAVAHGGGLVQITVEAGGEDLFSPDHASGSALNQPGFQWDWGKGTIDEHNVRQDSKLFYSGQPTDFQQPFRIDASAGTYHYYCEVHGSKSGGMDGELDVAPSSGSLKQKHGGRIVFEIFWASENADTGNQFDVQYRVGNRDWKYWKKNTAKRHGLFGKNGKPVTVKDGKVYKVRVRSEKASNPDKRSDWSPALAFSTNV
jgi:plastocyanin